MNQDAGTVEKKSAIEMIKQYFRDFKVLKDTSIEYWGIQIVNFLDCMIYFAVLGIVSVFLSDDLAMSDVHAGYTITIFTSATTIFLFFSGMVTDWLGIRKSLYLAVGVSMLLRFGLTAVGLIDTIPNRGIIAGVLLFLMAPVMAMIQTVFQAANKRFTSTRSRGAGFNLWYLFMNVGAAAGGFLIDIVRKTLSLPNSYLFLFGGATSILCLLAVFFVIKREEQYRSKLEQEQDAASEEEKKAPAEKKNPFQIAKAVLSESVFWRFLVLVSLLLGVRAVFTYMYLLMPKYWLRVIGPDAPIGTYQAINPILIVGGLILFIPFANRYNIFKMLVYGAMISSLSMFVLALPYDIVSTNLATGTEIFVILSLVMLSIGEVIWSPKLSEYTASIAPQGQEGTYLGLSMAPWFLAKTMVSIFSGHMLERWVPEGVGEKMAAGEVAFWDSPNALWFYLGVFAFIGPFIALLLKGWLTKGARWTSDEHA